MAWRGWATEWWPAAASSLASPSLTPRMSSGPFIRPGRTGSRGALNDLDNRHDITVGPLLMSAMNHNFIISNIYNIDICFKNNRWNIIYNVSLSWKILLILLYSFVYDIPVHTMPILRHFKSNNLSSWRVSYPKMWFISKAVYHKMYFYRKNFI